MMRLEIKRRKTSDGAVREQLYAVVWKGGKRTRVYVRKAERSQAYDAYAMQEAMVTKPAEPLTPRPRGRPSTLPNEMYEVARLAGYTRRGTQLSMSRSDFLKPEAAAVRFHLLDDHAQAALGSPERLHEAGVKAVSILKSRNRKSVPTSYAECMAEALAAYACHAKIKPEV